MVCRKETNKCHYIIITYIITYTNILITTALLFTQARKPSKQQSKHILD